MGDLDEILRRVEEGMDSEDAEAVKLAKYGYGIPQHADAFDGAAVDLVRGAKNQETTGGDRYDTVRSQGKARKLLKRIFVAHHSTHKYPRTPADLDKDRTKPYVK